MKNLSSKRTLVEADKKSDLSDKYRFAGYDSRIIRAKSVYLVIVVEEEAVLAGLLSRDLENREDDGMRGYEVLVKHLKDKENLTNLLQRHYEQGALPAAVVLHFPVSDYKLLKPYKKIRLLYPDLKLICCTDKHNRRTAVNALNNRLLDLYLDKEGQKELSGRLSELISSFHEERTGREKRITRQLLSENLAHENRKLNSMLAALERIADFATEISRMSQLDLDELLDFIVSEVPSLFGAKAISIFLCYGENEKFHLVRDNHIGKAVEYQYGQLKDSPMQKALTDGVPVIIKDTDQSHLKFYNPDELGRSCIVIPFVGSSSKPGSWEERITLNLGDKELTGVLNISKLRLGDEELDSLTYRASLIQKVLSRNISKSQLHRIYRLVNEHRITDKLTGLYNKRMFMNLIKMEFERAKRFKHNFSIVSSQMEGYPEITGKYGKKVGESLLKELGTFLKNNIRRSDMLAFREASDFMMILPSTDGEHALLLLENLKAMLVNLRFTTHELAVNMSYGVTVSCFPKIESVTAFFDRCELALGEAGLMEPNSIVLKK